MANTFEIHELEGELAAIRVSDGKTLATTNGTTETHESKLKKDVQMYGWIYKQAERG